VRNPDGTPDGVSTLCSPYRTGPTRRLHDRAAAFEQELANRNVIFRIPTPTSVRVDRGDSGIGDRREPVANASTKRLLDLGPSQQERQ